MPQNPYDEAVKALPPGPTPVKPATPRPFNPYDEVVSGDWIDPLQARMRAQRLKAQDEDRDARVKAQGIGKVLGVPPAWIDSQQVPALEKQAREALVPYSAITAGSPGLASWLAEHPDAAAISGKPGELPRLGLWEWLSTMPSRAWWTGMAEREANILRAREAQGYKLTDAEEQTMLQLENEVAVNSDFDVGNQWWRKAVTGNIGVLPNIILGMASGGRRAAMGYAGGFVVGGGAALLARGAIGPPLTVARGVGSIAAGYTGRVGIWEDTATQEAGAAWKEFKDFEDAQGRKIDPDAARAAALASGAINGVLEVGEIGILVKAFKKTPVGQKMVGAVGRRAIKEILRRRTVVAALAHAGKVYAQTLLLKEAPMEALQRIVAIVTQELGKAATEDEPTHRTLPEIVTEVKNEYLEAATSMSLVVGLPAGTQAVRGVREAKDAPAITQFFTTFGDVAAASDTVKDAPEAAQAFLKRAAGRSIPYVYAPTDLWDQYWQKQDIDPDGMADSVLGEAGALEKAKQAGVDLQIPIERYGTMLAPTEHNTALADMLRVAPREWNGIEAREFAKARAAIGELENLEDTPAEAGAPVEGAEPTPQTPQQQLAAVTKDIADQLVLTRRYTRGDAVKVARLWAAGVGQTAVDMGEDIRALAADYGLVVRSTIDPRIAAAARPRPAAAPTGTPSAVAPEAGTPQPLTLEGQVPQDEAQNALRQGAAAAVAAGPGVAPGPGPAPDTTIPPGQAAEAVTAPAEAETAAAEQQRSLAQAAAVEDAVWRILDPEQQERELGERLGDEAATRVLEAFAQATRNVSDVAQNTGADTDVARSLEDWLASDEAEQVLPAGLLEDAREAVGIARDEALEEFDQPVEPGAEPAPKPKKAKAKAYKLNLYNLAVAPLKFVGRVLYISTRVPDGPDAQPATDPLTTQLPVLLASHPKAIKRYADKLRSFEMLTPQEKRRSDRRVIEDFIQRGTENLRWLWDLFEPEIRERARLWYQGGHNLAQRIADRHNLSINQGAALIASLSPQMDWFKNMNLAFRVADLFAQLELSNPDFDQAMFDSFAKRVRTQKLTKKQKENLELTRATQEKKIAYAEANYLGRTWSEIGYPGKAIMLREVDEQQNADQRWYHVITPEGGFQERMQTNPDARGRTKDMRVGWGTYPQIANAIAVLDNGSALNIHARLGGKHKVRSFYMNLVDPSNANVVTIDTHAAAAFVMQPLAGTDRFVANTLDAPPGIKENGLMGLNVVVAEGYFRLAKQLSDERRAQGLPPITAREVQSVTWEAVRLLFPAAEKRVKNQAEKVLLSDVQAIWKEFTSGTIDIDATRRKILARIERTRPMGRPSWADAGAGLAPDEGELPGRLHYGGGARLPARPGATLDDPAAIGGQGAAERGGIRPGLGVDPAAEEVDPFADEDVDELGQPLEPTGKARAALRLYRASDQTAASDAMRLVEALEEAGIRLPDDAVFAARMVEGLVTILREYPNLGPGRFAEIMTSWGLNAGVPAGPPPLILQHNTTERKLRQVLSKLGGFFAVPSLAITGVAQALEGFGNITLLGDRELADPSKGAKVFGADIYSPRYPEIVRKLSRKAMKRVLGPLVKKWKAIADEAIDDDQELEALEEQGIGVLYELSSVHLEFLERQGIRPAPPVMEVVFDRETGQIDYHRSQALWRMQIQNAQLGPAFSEYVQGLWDSLEPQERIERGRTESGNVRPTKPHTLENVVQQMKRGLRGGESSQMLYGIGQVRARVTPQFRTLDQVRREAGARIVTNEVFQTYKEQINTRVDELGDKLSPYHLHSVSDRTVVELLYDTTKMGLSRALIYNAFANVPADVQAEIGDFLTSLKTLPTEYFEVKHTRAIGLSEFKAAVVPDTVAPDIRTALEAAGLDVRTYPQHDEGARRDTIEATAADLDVVFQEDEERRGSFQYNPRTGKMRINLFTQANPSTALHELGHAFMRVLHDAAQRALKVPEAERTPGHARVIANYNKALQTLGARSFGELTTEQHERWADQFVAYLRSGKAPSRQHRDLFAAFRTWLLRVYQNYVRLGGEVHPELKKVFDRLLATDAEIAEAEADGHVVPLFATEQDAKMSPGWFAAYRQAGVDAHTEAIETLDAQLQQEVAREQTEAWQAQRANVQAQVTDEVHQRPVYRAVAAMRRGTTPGGESLTPGQPPVPSRMDRAAAVVLYGKERVQALQKRWRGIFAKPGEVGTDPKDLAEMFGFAGGDQMVTALTDAPDMQAVIEAETDRRMLAEHGSLLLSNELSEAAEQAVTNEKRQVVIEAELRAIAARKREVAPFVAEARREAKVKTDQAKAERDALARDLREARAERRTAAARMRGAIPSRAAILAAVQGQLAVTQIGKLRPDRYWAAMQKASRLAVEAAARGDWETAAHQKTLELTNLVLYREAMNAKQQIAKREQAMKQLEKTTVQQALGKAGGNFLAQINGFVSRYGLASVRPDTLANRPAIGPWLAGRKGEGDPVEELSPMVQDDTTTMDYRDLPLEQFLDLTDDIAMLAKWARRQTNFAKLFDQADMLVMRDRLVEQAGQVVRPHGDDVKFFTDKDKARREAGLKYARKLKLGAIARILDGGKDDGLFWNTFVRPFNVAEDQKRVRKAAATVEFDRLIRLLPGGYLGLKEEMHVEGVGSMPREARLAIASYWGTKTGQDRLLHDPVRNFSRQQYELVIDTLNEQEWAYVNGTITYINTFWPEIADLQERVTGLRPEKVPAEPFLTKFGEQPGGYYPIMYDPRLGTPAQQHETAQALEQMKKGSYLSATTKQGFTKPRVEHYKGAMKLEVGVAWTHVDNVIHDLTHREVFLDINRLLKDQTLDQALRVAIGAPMKEQIAATVEAIAIGDGVSHAGEEALNYVRQGAQMSALALGFWTAAQQPGGIINGAQRVGTKWVARALWTWVSSPTQMLETVRWINSKSLLMTHRGLSDNQDTVQLRQDFEKAGGWFDVAIRKVTSDRYNQRILMEMYLYHINIAQRFADVPTWLGGYEKHMADPMEDRTPEQHEQRAIHLADQGVIDSQGSGSIKDLSLVQRGGPAFKSWLSFFSYGNTTWNSWQVAKQTNPSRLVGALRPLQERLGTYAPPAPASPDATISDIGKLMADYLGIYTLPAAYVVLAGNALGKFGDDDWLEWFAHIAAETVGGHMNGLVLWRNMSSIVKGYIYGDPGRYEGPMAARLFSASEQLIRQIVQGENDLPLWMAANEWVGPASGGIWPSAFARNWVRGWVAMEEGRTRNPFVLFVGPPPKEKGEGR